MPDTIWLICSRIAIAPKDAVLSGGCSHTGRLALLTCFLLFFCSTGTIRCQGNLVSTDVLSADSKTYYAKGMELVKQGEVDAAIQVFEQGIAVNPQNAAILDAIGATYLMKGDTDQAKRYLSESLSMNPGFVPARKNLAMIHFSAGEYELAATEFEKLTKVAGPVQQVANLFLGMISEKKGEHTKTVAFLSQTGELLYRYPDALLAFAEAQHGLGHKQKAEAALKSLTDLRGVTPGQRLKASRLYTAFGDDQLALAEINKASAQDSRAAGLEFQRAVVLDRVGRSKESLEILKEVAKDDPDPETLIFLARVARENSEFALALNSLREAAKLAPDKEESYLDFSTLCADYGNQQLALEAAEVGLEHIPNSYRLLVQKAVVLENLGKLSDAEDALRTAGVRQRDNSLALLCLAIVQTHAVRFQEAEATLTSALKQYPSNYYMHYQLGLVLVELQGGGEEIHELRARTKRAFQEAIRLNSSFADSYYQLAKLYSENSPKLEEQNLVACLKADPNHAQAEFKLARLYASTGRAAEARVLMNRFEQLREAATSKEMQQPRIEAVTK